MVSTATKVRLGIFIAIGSLLILVFAAAVAGNKFTQKWDTYYVMFENYPVAGLQVGGTVNYQGIKVGRVESIKIDSKDVTKVIITINVEAGTPIKVDTEVVLSYVGITGLKAVDIRGGTNAAKLLKPNSYIKTGSTMISDISGRALSIAEKIDIIAANISEITSTQNQANLASILSETSLLLSDTRANLGGTLQSLNEIAANTSKVTEGFGQSLEAITINLNKNMDMISASAVGSMDSLTTVSSSSLRQLTNSLNSELLTVTQNLNTSITNINEQSTLLLADSRNQINTIGNNTNTMILDTSRQLTEITTNINGSLAQINTVLNSPEFFSLLENLGKLSGELSDANLKGMVEDISLTIKRTSVLVNTLNRTVLRSQDNITETMENLREASENLNELSRQLSENPAILLRGN